MKFTLENNALTITSESKLEAFSMLDHYRVLSSAKGHTEAELDASINRITAALAAVSAGDYTHVEKGTDKRPWFRCEANLGEASMRPYLELLRKLTGYAGEVPEVPYAYRWYGLHHTHFVEACSFSSAGIKARGFIRSEDWYGEKAEDRARKHFRDYVTEEFGFRKHEREYVEAGNGHVVRNPHYLKHHLAQPGLGSPELWDALFGWWRAHHATAAQEAVLKQAEECAKRGGLGQNSWEIRKGGNDQAGLVDYAGIRTSYNDSPGLVKWDEFVAMAEGNTAVGSSTDVA